MQLAATARDNAVSITDVPYSGFPMAYAGPEFCDSVFIISRRDPAGWARSRIKNHGEDPVCAARLWSAEGRADGVANPLDLLECAAHCDSLRGCFVSQAELGHARLADAFARSEARLMMAYGSRALVIDLFKNLSLIHI